MAEHLLDHSEIGAVIEHVRCAGVPEHMGRERRFDTRARAG
jgi:hypothetical protein